MATADGAELIRRIPYDGSDPALSSKPAHGGHPLSAATRRKLLRMLATAADGGAAAAEVRACLSLAANARRAAKALASTVVVGDGADGA